MRSTCVERKLVVNISVWSGSSYVMAVREASATDDEATLAEICCRSFNAFNASVGLAPEFSSSELAAGLIGACLHNPGICSFVAVAPDGSLCGSNHVDLRDDYAAIGPISVEPEHWDKRLGKMLMRAAIDAAEGAGKEVICLQQVIANSKSFSLYASLGFAPRQTCAYLHGLVPLDCGIHGLGDFVLTSMSAPDGAKHALIAAALYERALGHSRAQEISGPSPVPQWALHTASGDLVAFSTGFFLGGVTLATNFAAFQALLVLVSVQYRQNGCGELFLHLPVTNIYFDVLQWCLNSAKLRLDRQTTLMVREKSPGSYRGIPPNRAGWDFVYCPSISY